MEFKNIRFTETKLGGSTSIIYFDNDKEYVLKKIIDYEKYNVYEREKFVMQLLNTRNMTWCPKLIDFDDNQRLLLMEHCGNKLQKSEITQNIESQFKKILRDMRLLKLKHNDIWNNELLLKNGKLHLVDFGWASINGNHSCGIGLWHGNKPFGILADNRPIRQICRL